MNIFDLAQKILGREKSVADKSESDNQTGTTITYMTAVTSSSNGEVVLTDEENTSAEWAEGDYTEVLEDGEYIEEDVPEDNNDIDDGVIDMTDGDGADIEDSTATTAYTVAAYQADAQAAYAAESAAESDPDEDAPPGEDASITTDTDDGDAKDLPDTGGDTEDPEAGEDAKIDDLPDTDYTLVDDDIDDVSDVVEGAETSDGYMAAETIGSINEGDRVAVMIQDGKPIVLGVVGSGDEQRAEVEINAEAAEAATSRATTAQDSADAAQESADAITGIVSGTETETGLAGDLENLNIRLYGDGGDIESITSATSELSEATKALRVSQEGLTQNVTEVTEQLESYKGYVAIDDTEPSITVGAGTDTKLKLMSDKMSFTTGGNEAASLSNDKLKAASSEVTNLYMRSVDSNGKTIGMLGWVARSNGHLSLKAIE